MTTNQARVPNHDARSAAITGFGIGATAVATAALVALLAFGGTGQNGGGGRNGGIVVPPPTAIPSNPAETPHPSATPKPDPATPAPPRPSAKPSAKPSARPIAGDGTAPVRVRLVTANEAVVTVDVVDETSKVADARSGRPADGVSVDFDTVGVENIDPSTLQVTWSDYPIDNALTLLVSEDAGHLRLVLVRPEPSGSTDSIAMDRALLLRFAEPVDASGVQTFIQDGLDTAS